MANMFPCMVLDEHHKDTGLRNYSNCNPMCCTAQCDDLQSCKRSMYLPNFLEWRPQIVVDHKNLLRLLRDVEVQRAVRAIVSEKEKDEEEDECEPDEEGESMIKEERQAGK